MSNAVSFFPWDPAMISVVLSGVTAIPFGKGNAVCNLSNTTIGGH